jgi:hypothetical protein
VRPGRNLARGLSAWPRRITGNLCVQPPVPGERVGVSVIRERPGRGGLMGSVIKKRRKRMAKKKHRKLLKKTRIQRRNKK